MQRERVKRSVDKYIFQYRIILMNPGEHPPLHESARDAMERHLDDFVRNPGLDELAALYGRELPADPDDRLDTLQELAAASWNYRKGATRQETDWSSELDDADSEHGRAIAAAADRLGMAASTKPERPYPDWLIIPGGANKAPLDRLNYGLTSTNPGAVAYLGSGRLLSDDERTKAKGYAPEAKTEFDLGCAAVASIPGVRLIGETSEDRDGDVWRIRKYVFRFDGQWKEAYIIGAPAEVHDPDGTSRAATTYDNFQCFADGVGMQPGMHVVVATTGLYVPEQHLPAVQVLTPNGISVETIGHDAAFSGAVRKPKQYLQETKAAIDAAVRLRATLR